MSTLKTINSPQDLKKLPISRLPALAEEIRQLIISTVSMTGGHLASSLGAVELITALHYTFNTPDDKIIFDVGHQAYAHKILTGRKSLFHGLRQENGISGFIRPDESIYDSFASGHSGTAISAALGIAKARDINNLSHKIIAVIGDGTLTSGIAYEALNNAGHNTKNFIIVLNDNEMAISPCVGAMAKYLNKIIASPVYNRIKKDLQNIINRFPALGQAVVDIGKRIEEGLKGILVPGILFEELGFRYFGPVDGHNTKILTDIMTAIKDIKQPVILHVLTKKGKGYRFAEKAPETFHGAAPFNVNDGKSAISNHNGIIPGYTDVFSATLCKLARYNPKITAITAAMAAGTGLDDFRNNYPSRFFDVGIAEQHAVTFAAGMAASGLRPVVAIYSTFLQRAYDQIVVDVCLQNLPVVFAVDRAGIVGEDGPTHHGVFDISYTRHIPNLVVMQPQDENELQHMLYTALRHPGPSVIRYPRGTGLGVSLDTRWHDLPLGKSELIFEGKDGVIIALGPLVDTAKKTIKLLRHKGIYLGLVNARFVKPLDQVLLKELAENYPCLFTLEDNVISGGFGSAVLEFLSAANLSRTRCINIGIPDRFIPHGTITGLKNLLNLTPPGIAAAIESYLFKPHASQPLQDASQQKTV